MNKILVIAKNTFKEAIRDRILYAILAFAILFIASTILLGSLSLGEDIKVIRDFGLAGIYIFGLIITIFLGTTLIFKEIERRTIYIVLSKPVSTYQVIVGKFLGLFASVLLTIILMAGVYLIIVASKGGGFDSRGLLAVVFELFEIMVFISLTILFSSFAKPFSAMIYSVLIVFIGHSLSLLTKYGDKIGGIFKFLSVILYYLLPNLEKFNIRNLVIHSQNISLTQIILAFFYALLYSSILLILANSALKRQEF